MAPAKQKPEKDYDDIPGTYVFDADRSRRGYHVNMFCMSLMKAENRIRFKADERAYLDEWPMTEPQRAAVLARDLNRCISLGGNIYFLAKVGATDGRKAAPGTVRGDYSLSNQENLIHASDSAESAAREIALWFPEI